MGEAQAFGEGGRIGAAATVPPGPLLRAENVRRSFGRLAAVDGASFAVPGNSITGLIGPNGAGKSTLFNLMAGLIAPDGGKVYLDGQDVTGWPTYRLARIGLTHTFQIARGLADLTVLENLMLYAPDQPGERVGQAILRTAHLRRREREVLEQAWAIADQLKLTSVANNLASALSGGQKKLLELGRALMAKPRLLMLDEPMAGVNPTLAQSLAEVLLDIRKTGVTLLVVEHNMNIIGTICDEVIVLAAGKVLASGRFAEIRTNPAVQSAYLGSRA